MAMKSGKQAGSKQCGNKGVYAGWSYVRVHVFPRGGKRMLVMIPCWVG